MKNEEQLQKERLEKMAILDTIKARMLEQPIPDNALWLEYLDHLTGLMDIQVRLAFTQYFTK